MTGTRFAAMMLLLSLLSACGGNQWDNLYGGLGSSGGVVEMLDD